MDAGGVKDTVVHNAVGGGPGAGDDALVARIGKGGENALHAVAGDHPVLDKIMGDGGKLDAKALLLQDELRLQRVDRNQKDTGSALTVHS